MHTLVTDIIKASMVCHLIDNTCGCFVVLLLSCCSIVLILVVIAAQLRVKFKSFGNMSALWNYNYYTAIFSDFAKSKMRMRYENLITSLVMPT